LQPFSEKIVEEARNVNLVDYLKSIGEPLIKEGKEYRLKKHDSLTINPVSNLWKWNSRQVGGKNAIDYLETVENMSFVGAVSAIMGKAGIIPDIRTEIREKPPPENKHADFALPPPAVNTRRVFAYLHRERRVMPSVINHFIKCGDLYEDAEHHNAVFVGRDENGVPRFAHKRSTNTLIPKTKEDGKKLNNRWDVAGSDKRFAFKYAGTSDRLFVFEAPIDMMSFISLREMTQAAGTWKEDSYISLDGISDLALKQAVTEKKAGEKLKRIVFCLDADEPGKEAAHALCSTWGINYKVRIKKPAAGKDFNDMLKAMALSSEKPLLKANY
jgi:hypothetical protein